MPQYEFQSPRVESFEELNRFLTDMIYTFQQALTETEAVDLRVTNREPERPRDGMIVYADGANWDPGSGRGLYIYDGGWVRLVKTTELGGHTWNDV